MVVTFCFIMCGYMKHISLYPYNDSHLIYKMYSAINFLPSASYSPSQHITPINSRPDVIWWFEENEVLCFLELTVSFVFQRLVKLVCLM